jgi:hypothetical protein
MYWDEWGAHALRQRGMRVDWRPHICHGMAKRADEAKKTYKKINKNKP